MPLIGEAILFASELPAYSNSSGRWDNRSLGRRATNRVVQFGSVGSGVSGAMGSQG